PETSTYTLDTKWATAPAVGSRFEISEGTSALPGYQPSSDSYQVVLSSQPSGTVYVDVTPQPTRTYNSNEAFDPAANFGQNNLVQVRVKTPRAVFLLTGEPASCDVVTPGPPVCETWTITINDRAYSYHVATGDTLTSIAAGLAAAIMTGNAGYTATIDPSNAHQIIVEAVTSGPFYAGFQITHDLA